MQEDLGPHDHAHKDHANEDSQCDLRFVGTFARDLLFVQSVGVDVFFSMEILILRRPILEVSDQPLVWDSVLLSLPAFVEKGEPEEDDNAVDGAVGSVEYLVPTRFCLALTKRDEREDEG